MSFAISISLLNLLLYCGQQLGVMLGVGAETVLLAAYLQSMRDGVMDDKEQSFARAVRKTMEWGLFFIVVSGLGVIATYFLTGNSSASFSDAFLFKWSLILIVLVLTLTNRGFSLANELLQGVAAGTWYALFVVHILAPDAAWLQLAEFYAIWLIGFCICWTLLVFALKGKSGAPAKIAMSAPAVAIKPAPIKTPTPIQKPIVAAAPVPAPKPKSEVVIKPAPAAVPTPPPKPPVHIQPAPVPPPPVAKVMPAPVPMPPPPKPVVVSVPTPPPPPTPPPAPKPSYTAPQVQPEKLTGLHVMPRTMEEVQQRRAATA